MSDTQSTEIDANLREAQAQAGAAACLAMYQATNAVDSIMGVPGAWKLFPHLVVAQMEYSGKILPALLRREFKHGLQ